MDQRTWSPFFLSPVTLTVYFGERAEPPAWGCLSNLLRAQRVALCGVEGGVTAPGKSDRKVWDCGSLCMTGGAQGRNEERWGS